MNKIFVGTSGYFYPHWKGVFYPEDMPSKEFLKHYIKYFNTLELNSSFYHLPKESTFKNWYRTLPSGFLLSIKANRIITHLKKLRDVENETKNFLLLCSVLREKLGAILFQLPPSLKYNEEVLNGFLAIFKKDEFRIAVEFRNKSWLIPEVFEDLRKKNIAVSTSHGAGIPYTDEITSNFAYFRMHGPTAIYSSGYSKKDLIALKEKLNKLKEKNILCFVYFNNDFGGFAVKDGLLLIDMLKY